MPGGYPDLLYPLYGCVLIGKGVEPFEQGDGLDVIFTFNIRMSIHLNIPWETHNGLMLHL